MITDGQAPLSTPSGTATPAEAQVHGGSTAIAVLRAALALVAIAVVVQAACGFAHRLGVAPALVPIAWAAAAATAWGLGRDARRGPRRTIAEPQPSAAGSPGAADERGWTRVDIGAATALLAMLADRAWAGLHRTTFFYDVLSYHLHIPATWRAAGAITIVPTPFGDPAPAYAPANTALLAHLEMAATGNARLAHAGQVPFAALAALAIYASARELGARRAAGLLAATAFLLVPEVWQQAPTAMADLVLAGLFLAAIPFLLRLRRARTAGDVVGLGLALGLLIGTKYVAAVIAAPLAAWTAVVLMRRSSGWSRARAAAVVAALVVGCGGFWYLRNVVLTGNPIFPVTWRIGPLTLARGRYGADEMRAWAYHVPVRDVQALLQVFVDTGWGFVAAAALATAVAFAAARPNWPVLAMLLTALIWFVVPYQESRFFFAVWGVVCVALAAATTRAPRSGAAALGLATVGSILEFATPERLAIPAAAMLGAVVGPRLVAGLVAVRHARPRASARAAVAFAAVLIGAGWTWARAADATAAASVGDAHDDGWAWLRAHAHGAHIAYAGSNLPLPLWGPRFENRVAYVNVAGAPGAVLHDFRDVPVARPTAELAPERARPDLAAWLRNLDAAQIDLLFVVALYPIVQLSIAHDADGFPIERAWADARPMRFELAFAREGLRIYRLRAPATQACRVGP